MFIAAERPKKEENFTRLLKQPQKNNALWIFKKNQAFLASRNLSYIS